MQMKKSLKSNNVKLQVEPPVSIKLGSAAPNVQSGWNICTLHMTQYEQSSLHVCMSFQWWNSCHIGDVLCLKKMMTQDQIRERYRSASERNTFRCSFCSHKDQWNCELFSKILSHKWKWLTAATVPPTATMQQNMFVSVRTSKNQPKCRIRRQYNKGFPERSSFLQAPASSKCLAVVAIWVWMTLLCAIVPCCLLYCFPILLFTRVSHQAQQFPWNFSSSHNHSANIYRMWFQCRTEILTFCCNSQHYKDGPCDRTQWETWYQQ